MKSVLTCINNSIILFCHISTLEVWVLLGKNLLSVGATSKNDNTPFVEASQTSMPWAEHSLCKQKRSRSATASNSDCTRLVHSVVSFPVALSSVSTSSWLCASVLAAAVCEFGLPPRAAASCISRSAMRWFSFSSLTFPSWASRSQCSFSCSSRAIFSWLCCTCGRPTGRGEERTVSLWEEGLGWEKWGQQY